MLQKIGFWLPQVRIVGIDYFVRNGKNIAPCEDGGGGKENLLTTFVISQC